MGEALEEAVRYVAGMHERLVEGVARVLSSPFRLASGGVRVLFIPVYSSDYRALLRGLGYKPVTVDELLSRSERLIKREYGLTAGQVILATKRLVKAGTLERQELRVSVPAARVGAAREERSSAAYDVDYETVAAILRYILNRAGKGKAVIFTPWEAPLLAELAEAMPEETLAVLPPTTRGEHLDAYRALLSSPYTASTFTLFKPSEASLAVESSLLSLSYTLRGPRRFKRFVETLLDTYYTAVDKAIYSIARALAGEPALTLKASEALLLELYERGVPPTEQALAARASRVARRVSQGLLDLLRSSGLQALAGALASRPLDRFSIINSNLGIVKREGRGEYLTLLATLVSHN